MRNVIMLLSRGKVLSPQWSNGQREKQMKRLSEYLLISQCCIRPVMDVSFLNLKVKRPGPSNCLMHICFGSTWSPLNQFFPGFAFNRDCGMNSLE